jgi:hypothetical protein
MLRLKQFVNTNPFFLLLFPFFFVLHGYVTNYDSVPIGDALLLIAKYIIISLLIVSIFWLFYRDIAKACLLAFVIMAFHFFFGNILDLLKVFLPDALLRYRYILPLSLFFFIALFIVLKKRKKSLFVFSAYLNLLLIILILFDIGVLMTKIPITREKKAFLPAREGLTICDTCSKPDIFLIIPDQYAGYSALKDVFGFDNSAFENELEARGFYIAKQSSSNYNFTPFSVASILDMEFLSLKPGRQNYNTVRYSYEVIRNSKVLKFLATSGYRIYKCSIFDYYGKPAHKNSAFLPNGISLLTAQTYTTRIADHIRQDI